MGSLLFNKIRSMDAAILAVGSELLETDRLDTNSLAITRLLRRHGVRLVGKSVVGDDVGAIAVEVARWMAHADLVVIGGGLGPTADDVTREGVARALDRGLTERADVVAEIVARFAAFGMEMPEVNRRQAMVLDGAEVISNPRGSAPAQMVETEQGALMLYPGVPSELAGMLRDHLEPLAGGPYGRARHRQRHGQGSLPGRVRGRGADRTALR